MRILDLLRREGAQYRTPVRTESDGRLFIVTPERSYGHVDDLTGSVRVNFGRETFWVPSFAAAFLVTIPSGVDSRATCPSVRVR